MKIAPNNKQKRKYSIEIICNAFNLKRDAYYKYQKRFTLKNKTEKNVVELVMLSRKILPRQGTRKLMKSLHSELDKQNIKVGRYQLFRILRENDLLVKRKKYSSRTTNSFHRFYKYNNCIKDLVIDRPN